MRRFDIAQDSMVPNLRPGEEVVAVDDRPARTGDVVVFPHPHRDQFWVVKRVARPPRPIADDQVWVLADNPESSRSDSRSLGPIDRTTVWTVVERLDVDSFNAACTLLAVEDRDLGSILERHGLPVFWRRSPGFPTLVWLIMEQQVSLESGAAMYRRLHEETGAVTPGAVAALGEHGLRSLGVTRQKAGYLVELALAVEKGALPLDTLGSHGLAEARAILLSMRGIGPWTADAYLLSALRHPDVFPVGDRALQVGVAEALGMTRKPDPEELEIISQPWRPIRAAAARIIWHGYLARRGRVEPADPTVAHGTVTDA